MNFKKTKSILLSTYVSPAFASSINQAIDSSIFFLVGNMSLPFSSVKILQFSDANP